MEQEFNKGAGDGKSSDPQYTGGHNHAYYIFTDILYIQ